MGLSTLEPAGARGVQVVKETSGALTIVMDPADRIARARTVRWAVDELSEALAKRGVAVEIVPRLSDAPAASLCVAVTGGGRPLVQEIFDSVQQRFPEVPEALALVPGKAGNRPVIAVCGHDVRGLVYAVLELTDRVAYTPQPVDRLVSETVVEQPANKVRSVMRLFASDVEDKSWYYDKKFWRRYLTMLAAERFNRFSLALGLGYDFTSGIRDAYFHFAYPFLVKVPGYEVRVTGVSEEERERNLEMLRFIGDETVARGLDFQLGIWTHGYRWTNSPNANHVIEGLTPQTHAAYCRDALRTLLRACRAIHGMTFRVHGESGVAEGSYAFWRTVFDGIVQCGRRVEIDMHAKGMDEAMINVALATGMPVTISPKFWAEHLGLPYHQAGIRPTEKPPQGRADQGFFSRSSGSRSFLRYGYGDLLVEGRRYDVLHRIWPGTQRLLLWGDPVFAAGYGRVASFCGSAGMEIFEPLSFKGRKGSGLPGGRDAYAGTSLKSAGGDFEKYLYGYRLWGRLLYNPDTSPEVWRRLLSRQYGRASEAAEKSLGSASRILPLITTAHLPSAANNNYWPEIYTNMPIVDAKRKHPYGDTPSPKRFGTVSPIDPQLFSRVDDFAKELLKGERSGRYSPLEVAEWLLNLAESSDREAASVKELAANPDDPALRRLAVDVAIQSGLGRFFAQKLRAGVLFALHERTGDRRPLEQALSASREARETWKQFAARAEGVYVPDITFGLEAQLRGHWQDRLGAMDLDIADMAKRLEESAAKPASIPADTAEALAKALRMIAGKPVQNSLAVRHTPPATFRRGEALAINLEIAGAQEGAKALSIRLFYRHTNQAEEFRSESMSAQAGVVQGAIPAAYTDSPFPLQYYFVVRDQQGGAWTHPGLGPNLDQQPYFVVRSAGADW